VTTVAFDTTVLVYAVGTSARYRAPCAQILRAAASGALDASASVEVLQEFTHVRARRVGDRVEAVRAARDVSLGLTLHPVEATDVERALELFVAVPELDVLDAVHAATALNRGIDRIVSADRAFDGVDGLERVDPVEAEHLLPARGDT
jgi:uncharacterized protein